MHRGAFKVDGKKLPPYDAPAAVDALPAYSLSSSHGLGGTEYCDGIPFSCAGSVIEWCAFHINAPERIEVNIVHLPSFCLAILSSCCSVPMAATYRTSVSSGKESISFYNARSCCEVHTVIWAACSVARVALVWCSVQAITAWRARVPSPDITFS